MNKRIKSILGIIAAAFIVAVFSFSCFATYYASDESGNTSVPSYIESIEIYKTDVDIPDTGDTSKFTPQGNLSLIDDILQSENIKETQLAQKQFLTVETKSGNTFYIVVDRDGKTENVHFLNMVDEADLMALINDEKPETDTCSCSKKCADGKVNSKCKVCKNDLSKCSAAEETTETTSEPSSTVSEEKKDDENSKSKLGIILLVLLLLAGGGFAIYYFKFKKPGKPDNSITEPDVDFEDDEEYEAEEQDD